MRIVVVLFWRLLCSFLKHESNRKKKRREKRGWIAFFFFTIHIHTERERERRSFPPNKKKKNVLTRASPLVRLLSTLLDDPLNATSVAFRRNVQWWCCSSAPPAYPRPFFHLVGFFFVVVVIGNRRTKKNRRDNERCCKKKKGGHKHHCTWKLCAQMKIERVEVWREGLIKQENFVVWENKKKKQ